MDWQGFHRLDAKARLARVQAFAGLTDQDVQALAGGLPDDLAGALIENVAGTFPLPLGLAVNFVVDGQEVVVPMAVEESSVVAAASHGAKLAAAGGGFKTRVDASITTAQVEVRDVRDLDKAQALIARHGAAWMAMADAAIPAMVARGGGARGVRLRVVADRAVVHIDLDCRDAMGANVANLVAERLGPTVAKALGGRLGLQILTNLADRRMARAACRIPFSVLPRALASRMVEANAFALADPYRAATHNKGIMNGIDPLLVATGNDWRAVEAGAHAFAARSGRYTALTRYRLTATHLEATIALPLAVGTVGGVTRLHPVAAVALKLLGSPDARRLAAIAASVGLAQNLAALRALSKEGIQRGHMSLHARNLARQVGATGADADRIAAAMVAAGTVDAKSARRLLDQNG